MKKLIYLLAALFVASCTNTEIEPQKSYEVVFNTNTLNVETRASLSETTINYINVYVDGEHYATQNKSSDTFGIISIILEKGKHTISFVGTDKAITDCSFTGALSDNIYGKVIEVDVDSTTPVQNITLERLVTKLTLKFDDSLYENGITKYTIESKFYNTFNPVTLNAIDITNVTKELTVSNAYIAGTSLGIRMLCPSTTFTNDVTIKLYKGDTLFTSYNMSDTPFEINKETIISGTWCTKTSNMNLTVNTNWSTPMNLSIN